MRARRASRVMTMRRARLLQDYNSAVNYGDQYEIEGKDQEAASNHNLSSRIYTQLTDNCLVVDS